MATVIRFAVGAPGAGAAPPVVFLDEAGGAGPAHEPHRAYEARAACTRHVAGLAVS